MPGGNISSSAGLSPFAGGTAPLGAAAAGLPTILLFAGSFTVGGWPAPGVATLPGAGRRGGGATGSAGKPWLGGAFVSAASGAVRIARVSGGGDWVAGAAGVVGVVFC